MRRLAVGCVLAAAIASGAACSSTSTAGPATPTAGPATSTQPVGGATATVSTSPVSRGERDYTAHTAAVVGLAWSAHGNLVADASDDSVDTVWDPTTLRVTATHTGHSTYEFAVAWSPDAHTLVSAGQDDTLQVWRARDGITLHVIQLGPAVVYGLAWSPSGDSFAATDGVGGGVSIWSSSTYRRRCHYAGQPDGTVGVAYSPDGTLVASAGADGSIALLDARTCQFRSGHRLDGPAWAVAFSPNGTLLAATVGAIGGSASPNPAGVQIWNIETGRLVAAIATRGPLYGLAWLPDSVRVVYAGGLLDNQPGTHDYALYLAGIGSAPQVLSRSHTNTVWAVAVGPDGTHVAAASQDTTVTIVAIAKQ